MVVVGNYSVRIVNAETKEPFKEHKGPDGKIYAEVEPDVEYFIEVDVIGGGKNSMACFEFHVDGEKLPYRTISNETHGKSYKGVWSCVNGVDKMQAFAFKRPVLTDSKGSSGPPGALIGDVQVDVSEAIYAGTCTRPDYKSDSLQAASVSSSLTNVQTKKVLRSGTGSVAETSARSIKVTSVYSPGVLLESITIHYCTALGLIHAGVFGKVEDIWAKARIVNPWKPSSDCDLEEVQQPKRVKRKGKMVNGVKVEAPKEVEEFDLTGED